jgi:hypothetical protein
LNKDLRRHYERVLDQEFRAWESMMWQRSPSARRQEDGSIELKPQLSLAEQLAVDALQERWAQRYVYEQFSRLGFNKVEGPFSRGPDYRVLHKRRWHWPRSRPGGRII